MKTSSLKIKEARQPEKTVISQEQQALLINSFKGWLFDYQKGWYNAGLNPAHHIRNIIGARQIGASDFFVREALIDALETGRDQIFLCTSESQVEDLKLNITQFAKDSAGVDLKGEPIQLPNDALLHFVDPSTLHLAAAYSGNAYICDYFWNDQFKRCEAVASGIAALKKFRKTYFSALSYKTHEAYQFWKGSSFNEAPFLNESNEIDVTHAVLVSGALCADGQWRQIVTVEDAVRGGCKHLDIDLLKEHFSEEEFKRLFMCEFAEGASA